MKKLIFGLIATVMMSTVSFGQNSEKPIVLKFLKTESLYKLEKLNTIVDSDFVEIGASIKSTNPIEFYSDELIINASVNKETQEKGFAYSLTNSMEKIRYGLFYGGGDCAVYGTYYIDDVTGVSLFVPASAATQFLLNVCGLSNMCKTNVPK